MLFLDGMYGLNSNTLILSDTDKLYHANNKFTLVFERSEDGKITALTFDSPRVSGVRFEKE